MSKQHFRKHQASCGLGRKCHSAGLMSVEAQSLHGRPSGKSGHVGYASESGSKFRALV